MSDRQAQSALSKRASQREFAPEEIRRTVEASGLLTLEMEPSYACNLNCLYCYASAGKSRGGEMSREEISNVLRQARGLGARRIILLGGEPLVYGGFRSIVDEIRNLGMLPEIFTNGTLTDRDTASFLWEREVAVTVKRNSVDPQIQDRLAGTSGAAEKMQRGLENLFEAGYPDERHHLGVQTIICRENVTEIEELWRWARSRGIEPYFECMTMQGRAVGSGLEIPPETVQLVFEKLSVIDREEYAIEWTPMPPIAAGACKRHLYSILVRPNGDISPCVGIDKVVGNVRCDRLQDVLRGNPVICDLRDIYRRIKGPCADCVHNGECYGCRGNAWQITGDYLASDPGCWLVRRIAPVARGE